MNTVDFFNLRDDIVACLSLKDMSIADRVEMFESEGPFDFMDVEREYYRGMIDGLHRFHLISETEYDILHRAVMHTQIVPIMGVHVEATFE
jgi:hypothetical protein